MSVEIEVGLENAARAPKIEEELPLEEEAPKGFGDPKTKRMLFGAGAAVLAALTGLFFFYHNPETTDDAQGGGHITPDRKSTRLNSSHSPNSYAVFCFKKKKK